MDLEFWILDSSGGDLERGRQLCLGLASGLNGRMYFRQPSTRQISWSRGPSAAPFSKGLKVITCIVLACE
jgi:hypothetical protein